MAQQFAAGGDSAGGGLLSGVVQRHGLILLRRLPLLLNPDFHSNRTGRAKISRPAPAFPAAAKRHG
jgi:acetyl esterase/lipase